MLWHPYWTFTNNPVAPVVEEPENQGGDGTRRNLRRRRRLDDVEVKKRQLDDVQLETKEPVEALAEPSPVSDPEAIRPWVVSDTVEIAQKISQMRMSEIDSEIKRLLNAKLRTDEEDLMLLILIAASV